MATRHALRGAATAWLTLIALQAVVTSGAGRVSGALSGLNTLVGRALDPRVPAIPDRRAGAGADRSQMGYITPAQAAAGAKVAANLPGIGAVTGPGGALGGLPSLGQYVSGGGLPAGLANNPALHPAG